MTTNKHWTRKAIKEHDCWWCSEKIDKGTVYNLMTILDGEKPETLKFHPECYGVYLKEDPWEMESYCTPGDYKRGTIEQR